MYRSFKTILILFAVAGLSSCDVLENQQPQQSLPAQGGLETIADYQSALIGAYNSVQTFVPNDDADNAAQLLFSNDIIADDAVWNGSFPTYVQIAQQQMAITNGSIEGQWNGAYVTINNANIILDGLVGLETDDQAAVEDIRGQALFIRALEYYYLVNYFAKPWGATSDNSHPGVPLQLAAVTSQADFQKPARSPVDSVYNQIINDLQEAQGLITETKPNRGTANAATALLARVALIQQRWQAAADLSGQVIPNYSLSGNVTDYFETELGSESIFEVQNTTQDVPDPANTSITAVFNADTRDDIQISDAYKDALNSIVNEQQQAALDGASQTAIDTRVTQLTTAGVGGLDSLKTPEDVETLSAASNTAKYEDVINSADNLPILRLSEMILTRAEALAELNGVNQESIDLLNQIRTRAITVENESGGAGDEALIQYTVADFQSQQELIDAILLERRVELAFEGHRKTDLQRRRMDVRGTAWDAPQLVFPIPQTQTDSNENICQNEGYGGNTCE